MPNLKVRFQHWRILNYVPKSFEVKSEYVIKERDRQTEWDRERERERQRDIPVHTMPWPW